MNQIIFSFAAFWLGVVVARCGAARAGGLVYLGMAKDLIIQDIYVILCQQ